MSEDFYKSPESDVSLTNKQLAVLPNPFVVALLIVGVSIVIGAILGGIEFLLGITLPANTFLSTIIPALIVGMYYGKKRQDYFPRSFRIKVILIWLAIGVVLAAVAFFFIIGSGLLEGMGSNAMFIGIFVGMILLGTLFTYFALMFGEKLGIKSIQAKA